MFGFYVMVDKCEGVVYCSEIDDSPLFLFNVLCGFFAEVLLLYQPLIHG